MSENLKQKVEEMKSLRMELEQGITTWENCRGYVINDELFGFVNLTEELKIG
jgi:hypothetical protein